MLYIGCPVKNGLLKNYEKMMQRKWGKTQPSGVINLFLIDLVKITREFILRTFPNFEDGNRYFCKALIYSRRKIINSYFNFIYTRFEWILIYQLFFKYNFSQIFPIFIPRLQLDTLYARATNRINSIFVTRRAIIEAFDRGFRIKSETGRQKSSNFQRWLPFQSTTSSLIF